MSTVRVHAGNDVHQGEEPSIIVVVFLVIESTSTTQASANLSLGIYASSRFRFLLFDIGIGTCLKNCPANGQFQYVRTLILFLHCFNSCFI